MRIRQTLGFDDRWLMLVGIPALGAAVPALFFGDSPATLGWAGYAPHLTVSLLYTTTYWLLARVIIAFWRRRCPGRTRVVRRSVKTGVSLVVLVILVELSSRVALGWGDVVDATGAEWDQPGLWQTTPVSLLLVLAMTAVYEAIYNFGLYRQAELERERLLRAQIETQLNALRKQIDPHFLFNSLNTLATIIPEDAGAAVVFTQRLSAAYRRLLEWRHAATVPVADELRALADYHHLLAVRFEGRLSVDIDIPQKLHARRIVPLALQTLVENAVKHNVASRAHPLRVRLWTEGTVIKVCNGLAPKPATRAPETSTGLGLQNLADAIGYLEHGALVVSEGDGVFCVSVPTGEPEGAAARPALVSHDDDATVAAGLVSAFAKTRD